MGSSIKASASTAERLIVCTGHLSALTRRWVTQNLREMLRGGHTSLQRPLPTFGTPHPSQNSKKGHGPAGLRTCRLGRALCLSVPDTSCRNQGKERTV